MFDSHQLVHLVGIIIFEPIFLQHNHFEELNPTKLYFLCLNANRTRIHKYLDDLLSQSTLASKT